MKALARIPLVLLLLAGLGSVYFASCTVETAVPYEFPSGVVNIIQHSENPGTPFWNWVEDKYPLFKANYTVQNDGWLEIYTYEKNGTRPEILVNGDETYATINPIFQGKVYEGDFYGLKLYPPEYLDSTFTIEVDNSALTIYEVYTWDDLIGVIVFSEKPRPILDPSISWSPVEPIEWDSLIITAPSIHDYSDWSWTLTGESLNLVNSDSHFITPMLDDGDYSITLYVEDEFGYNKTVTDVFTVEPNLESLLHDPVLTSVDVLDLACPQSVDPGSITDATVTISFSAPVSRDIRVTLVDTVTGLELSSIEDQLNGEETITYSMSFQSRESGMNVEVRAVFLHDEEWLSGGDVKASYISINTPKTEKSIPGYPVLGVISGLALYVLRRRETISPYK
jgi:hypothetical protein